MKKLDYTQQRTHVDKQKSTIKVIQNQNNRMIVHKSIVI